ARRWLELADGRPALLVWRQERARPFLAGVRRLLAQRPQPPWEQDQAALLLRLERLGLDAPRLLAAGYVGTARFLLCEMPSPTADLEAWLRGDLPGRAEVLARAGAFLRRLHDACFYLRGGGLAVRLDDPTTLALPDLASVEARRRASRHLAAR